MSPLTKTLIVLLTVCSIFLCGIVVTYVANADDYKEKSETLNTQLQSAKQNEKAAKKELEQKKNQFEQLERELQGQIASLKTELNKAKSDLSNAEREKSALLEEASKWKAITKDFYHTNDKQGQLLKNTLDELDKVRAEQIKLKRDLNETSNTLIEKMAVIETLETKIKTLREEYAELQGRIEKPLLTMGKTAAPPVTVTPGKTLVKPAMPVRDIDLKALVTAVDMKNSMAGISLGTADGVKEGMKFHVTRGDEFICDILIISVDTEEAVGVLELVQQQPRIGDNASTNL